MDIKTLSALGVRNLILRENGEIIDAWQQEAERYFNQYSVAKSFTAIACLQAVENGVWDLRTNIYDLVKDILLQAKTPDFSGKLQAVDLGKPEADIPESLALRQLTVHDLLSMQSGFAEAHMFSEEREQLRQKKCFNWLDYCLHLPFAQSPGSAFLYTNAAYYLAAVLLQVQLQQRLSRQLQAVFQAVGVEKVKWLQDPSGYEFGASDLFLTTAQLSSWGEILRKNDGSLLARNAIKRATCEKQVDISATTAYGYGFRIYPDGTYSADGKHGQYLLVNPKKARTLAVNSESTATRPLKKYLYELITT